MGSVPLPCDQAKSWLKTLLGVSGDDAVAVGTRSCKPTLLSRAAKFGLHRASRCILGYHVSPPIGIGSEMLYEADSQATSFREFSSVIEAVRVGEFFPDQPRGAQLANADANTPEEAPDACNDGDRLGGR